MCPFTGPEVFGLLRHPPWDELESWRPLRDAHGQLWSGGVAKLFACSRGMPVDANPAHEAAVNGAPQG